MKKIVIASLLALAVSSASALEVGMTVGRDYSGTNQNTFGMTVGQKYAKLGVSAGLERQYTGSNDQNRLSLVGSYELVKFGPVSLAPSVGVAYLNNQRSMDGYAVTVGMGASMPVTKQVSATVDVRRQYGQDRVQASDGNVVTAGLKYTF
jgi:hypothetical protein